MALNNLIDGRAIADQIHEETQRRVIALKDRCGPPGLVFVRVGEDSASRVYVGMKQKACERLGIQSQIQILPQETTEKELLGLIGELNVNPAIHGILIQAPLPEHINEANIFSAVSPNKDVDGFHPLNVGKLLLGDTDGFIPCTPAGVHELLIQSRTPIDGANVVILGRGNIVGKPMAAILCQKSEHANATVTLCHSRTSNIHEHCQRADILIAAIGAPQFVKEDMIKPGAVVIDVGVNRIPDSKAKNGSRLVGDVDFDAVQKKAGLITPNPGGVGPMTIAMLLRNTTQACAKANGLKPDIFNT
ncbi:MAG TPA: bifunctional 5,10-methylene-tetrahydrofolate dehydrogenase/5,10-methylene-tetrahydrofolate cyclohydrolase [Verrucomicrobiales bacterium]|nr:bifunctional 5,10-methylene-tetrahydrofolate dehydrogenase/5,10-methylene-tetrahydrofolate cyclohydrolase [Verrucomicrobiales bacterium]